jgi:hypothetical protein
MNFSHGMQVEHLETLKRNTSSPLERQMLHDILLSVLDSKSHITLSGNMIRCEMNLLRYKKYMKLVIEPERIEGPKLPGENPIITALELNASPGTK